MAQGVTRRCRRGGVFRRGTGTEVPPDPAVASWPCGEWPDLADLRWVVPAAIGRRRVSTLAMAEPPAAAMAGTAAPDRDVLLAAKRHMPAPQVCLVPRACPD